MPAVARAWEGERLMQYLAAYTKEMASSVDVCRRLAEVDRMGGAA